MMGKAHGCRTFPKCGAELNYHFILGPLFWECPHPGALPCKSLWIMEIFLFHFISVFLIMKFLMGDDEQVVPQADRVLVRLEELPNVRSFGSSFVCLLFYTVSCLMLHHHSSIFLVLSFGQSFS
jgi:hypothetical protein